MAVKGWDFKISRKANWSQVATRFIPAGAALLVEKPVAARLKPKFTSTHCYLCMRR